MPTEAAPLDVVALRVAIANAFRALPNRPWHHGSTWPDELAAVAAVAVIESQSDGAST